MTSPKVTETSRPMHRVTLDTFCPAALPGLAPKTPAPVASAKS